LLNFASTLEEEFKTFVLLTLTTSSTVRYHFQKKLNNTSFTTKDELNAIEGVGVLAITCDKKWNNNMVRL
jgi:hypothetical protein